MKGRTEGEESAKVPVKVSRELRNLEIGTIGKNSKPKSNFKVKIVNGSEESSNGIKEEDEGAASTTETETDDEDKDAKEEEADPDHLTPKSIPAVSGNETDEESNGTSDSEEDEDYMEEEEDAVTGCRRSSRKRTVRFIGGYKENQSWIVGGGGEARGYTRHKPRSKVELLDSEDNDTGRGRRHSSRLLRHQQQTNNSHSMPNGDVNNVEAENNAEQKENDDMYSRVKTLGRSRKIATAIQKDEPVSRRLRDRNKIRRCANDNTFGLELFRKVRVVKRKRSNSSESSSSSLDPDEQRLYSPSKKINSRQHFANAQSSLSKAMLMEAQPVPVDPSINFSSIGGLGKFINKLKEIVLFPLLYHEFYERRKMTAPRGILLYGPPGTGKTLLARALANECGNINGQKVSFFLRKGADLLNKFVGESERQLRILFQQAAQQSPSIIFFDEIDGLAPVRSSKFEQHNNSVVSSLLAEMDGLKDRGRVIVVGSTNRLEFIDPALRRPGRFDCELPIFLPTRNGRREILNLNVSKWENSVPNELLDELADRCLSFNGADLKLLCWSASMNSLRRTYPQIYGSSQKLLLDYDSIKVTREDWEVALKTVTPSIQRSLFSTYCPSQPLSDYIQPLLKEQLKEAKTRMNSVFFPESLTLSNQPCVKRCLIKSESESGLNTFIIPALFHTIESVPVHVFSFEALHMGGQSLDFAITQKCAQIISQSNPCVCYIPDFERLCDLLSDAGKEIIIRMMNQSVIKPILFLATVEGELSKSIGQCELMTMFKKYVVELTKPSLKQVRNFFRPVFEDATKVKIVKPQSQILQELPLAPPQAPVKPKLTEEELKIVEKKEDLAFRTMRIFLREVLTKIARNKKFEEFTRPVDTAEVPDYLEVINQPMDFESMMDKLNTAQYFTAKDFLNDINLIVNNCLQYNPNKTESDKRLRMRAYELKDFAEREFDILESDFEDECHEFVKNRKERNGECDDPNQVVAAPEAADGPLVTPSTSASVENNSLTNLIAVKNSTASRPSSASSTCGKKRRRSAWAHGSIKKPKRSVNPVRNLEKNCFSQSHSSPENTQSNSYSENVSPVSLPVMRTEIPEASSSRRLMVSLSNVLPRVVTQNTTNELEEKRTPSTNKIAKSSDDSTSEDVAHDRNGEFYSCRNESLLRKIFSEQLEETAAKCENLSVLDLINVRFELLKLVRKHELSEEKEDLLTDMQNLVQQTGSPQGRGNVSRSSFSLSGNSSFGSGVATTNTKLVKPPASSAPQLRFSSLEQRTKVQGQGSLQQRTNAD